VAEYIFHHGGSYLFGNSTCRKKWDELNAGKARQWAPDGNAGGVDSGSDGTQE
jgi:hypothetical protein